MSLAINISTFVSAGYTGNVIRWVCQEDVSNILNEIKEEPGPHGTTYNLVFDDGIRDIPYRIELYSVPPGASVGILIKSFVITPTTGTLILDADIEIIVGAGGAYDPVPESDSVVIEILKDKDFYIQQRGIGQLLIQRAPEYSFDNTTGEIILSGGTKFHDEDIYIIKFRAHILINPPGSQPSGSIYKDVVLLTADYTVTNPDFGKKFIVDGILPVVVIQAPAIADINSKIPLFIESIGQSHIHVIIQAVSGEKIQTPLSEATFILGRGERAELIKLGGVLYGFTDSIDIKKVCQIEWGYYDGLNRLAADGSEYLCADYPRVKKQLDKMQPGLVKTYTQWGATATVNGVTGVYINKGFFAISNDGLHFKVPDLMNKSVRALKNIDGIDVERVTNLPGGYQDSQFKEHGHRVNTTGNQGGVDPGRALQRGSTNGDGYSDADNGLGIGTKGPYIEMVGGIETRPENIGLIPLIII